MRRAFNRITALFSWDVFRVIFVRFNIFDVLSTKAKVINDVMKNVEAVRQLLGHASVAATSAYLGIEQAKALDIAKNHKMF